MWSRPSARMTVASPPVDDLEIEMRARSVEDAIRAARSAAGHSKLQPVSIIYTFPLSLSETAMTQATEGFRHSAERDGVIEQGKLVAGRGFIGVDGTSKYDDKDIAAYLERYIASNFHESEFDPDISARVIIRDIADTRKKLAAAAGLKYSYAQLDDYTNLISRSLLGVPQTSRVERRGVLPQAVYLDYSQERLASYGIQLADLGRVLFARNITLPGGSIEAGGREIQIDASGRFEDARSIGNVVVGRPYARARRFICGDPGADQPRVPKPGDVSEFLFLGRQERPAPPQPRHHARRLHAVRRADSEIWRGHRGEDEAEVLLSPLCHLRISSASCSALSGSASLQVKAEYATVDLFMEALYEAIGLVVFIALIGFWEWRSALLMALSMPITLAMTAGMAHTVNIDLQQVSIATLIIALGLLVDNPVVANDAIKRALAGGIPRIHAAWVGPTRLARAILYATATNIIAYLPFLMLTGSTGDFLYSLPIVMTAALISSRLVSMTFIPLLGYYLLRAPAKPEPTIEDPPGTRVLRHV